ncbi:hypothetical protein DXG01_017187 [Tephrocybe rancida]|nr:hypothetical protein DXG01_017187 [Tephrocybe rancida]
MFSTSEKMVLQLAGFQILDFITVIATNTLLYVQSSVDEAWLDDAYFHSFIPVKITVLTRYLLQIVGDVIVIWRAWVLCGGRAMILPLLLLLSVCSTTFAYFVLTGNPDGFFDESAAADHLFVAFLALSAATNMITTLIVGFKAWRHRKMWEFSGKRKKSRAEKTLLLIVESGCVYCVLQKVFIEILNVAFINVLVNYGTSIDYVSLVSREIYTPVIVSSVNH